MIENEGAPVPGESCAAGILRLRYCRHVGQQLKLAEAGNEKEAVEAVEAVD